MSLKKKKLEWWYKTFNDKLLQNWRFHLGTVIWLLVCSVLFCIITVNSFKDTVDFGNDMKESWEVLDRVLETGETTVPGFDVEIKDNLIFVSKHKNTLASLLGVEPGVGYITFENGSSQFSPRYLDEEHFEFCYKNAVASMFIMNIMGSLVLFFITILLVVICDLILWLRICRICDMQMKAMIEMKS